MSNIAGAKMKTLIGDILEIHCSYKNLRVPEHPSNANEAFPLMRMGPFPVARESKVEKKKHLTFI